MSMHFLTTVQCFTITHPLEPWLRISTSWLWDTSQNTKDDASFNAAQMLGSKCPHLFGEAVPSIPHFFESPHNH